jgi:demethylmenaquinone methyltransferase/2-methoxy-6-polyprenyl-1,4-benzoquinol methylase
VLAAQREYYELRAPDYADVARPSDRRHRGEMPGELVRDLIERLEVAGDVLELACGSGGFTRELVRHAPSLTALDGSPTMLQINQRVVDASASVEYICADLFEWTPPRQFDLIFFGFWLSHVPPTHFDSFWSMVRTALKPGGRVAFVDEDDRAKGHEVALSEGDVPTATRTLSDGQSFDIVKVFWKPSELEQRLRAAGWVAQVEPVGETFLFGVATLPG